jgi:nitrogenase iron protein NifH
VDCQQEVIMADHIAFYGKGGVGTSTLISNISAALVEAGFRVLQIGFSLKGDSCGILNGGFPIPTVWDQYGKYGTITFDSVVSRGFKDTYCIELGSPQGEQGASGTAQALDLLLKHDLISSLFPDFVLYDISGDQSCGVMPTLCEKIDLHRIFAVTTADFMSLTTVNSIMVQLEHFADNHVPVPFGGLLPNGIASAFEESFISDFAKHTGTNTLGRIPRSQMVRQCELYGKTVIEASPLSNQSYFYRRLANQIVDESQTLTVKQQPRPLSQEQLRSWAREWGDRLFALENGLVTDGAAI